MVEIGQLMPNGCGAAEANNRELFLYPRFCQTANLWFCVCQNMENFKVSDILLSSVSTFFLLLGTRGLFFEMCPVPSEFLQDFVN